MKTLATILIILSCLVDWTNTKGYVYIRWEQNKSSDVCFYRENEKQTVLLRCLQDVPEGRHTITLPDGPPTDGMHFFNAGDRVFMIAFNHEETDSYSAPIVRRNYIPMMREKSR